MHPIPIKEKLDKISSSFCSAKWLQVTLRLQNGHNHSCHHPKTHKISLDETSKNSSALHNTNFKKLQRKMMLTGERPSECSYCWKVEDLPNNQISDRYLKSSDTWSSPHINRIANQPWDQDIQPTYLEVSFSSLCNFKCAYCFPDVSTKWMSEIIEFGPYPTSDLYGNLEYIKKDGRLPIDDNDNPYIEAFWKWAPEVLKDLEVLRVTGGEPLLSKECMKLIDYIDSNPCPKLDFSINSNLGVHSTLVNKTIGKISRLVTEKKTLKGRIYTSLDTWGSQAEYVRYGLDLELWKNNVDICLSYSKNFETVIMVTFNALSVFKFKEFLTYVLEKRKEHQSAISTDISILHDPAFLSIQILEHKHKDLILDSLNFMKLNSAEKTPNGFSKHEIKKFERLWEYSKINLPEEALQKQRNDFILFIEEYDKRKKTNFNKTFPEMEATFKKWKLGKGSITLLEKTFNKLRYYAYKAIFTRPKP